MSRRELLLEGHELRRICDPAQFPFETTAELEGLMGIVGQSRAVGAMDFGLGTRSPGYNIFIVGQPGTGRTTYARRAVRDIAGDKPAPPDWCYVYNFSNPNQPKALVLPGGQGRVFCRDIQDLEVALGEDIPKAFDGEEYERQKARLIQDFQEVRTDLLEELTQLAKARGFSLKTTNAGFVTVPIVDGREVAQDSYTELDPPVQRDFEKRSQDLRMEAAEIMRRISQAERKLRESIRELDHRIGLSAVGHLIDELLQKYCDHSQVGEYLEAYRDDVLEHLDDFKTQEGEEQQLPALLMGSRRRDTHRYKVNLLVDNSGGQGAPVIFETNPTWYNLLGRVEYQNEMGSFTTDFTKIRAGAFHRANGGYLILHAMDLLANPLAWQALKRVLKTREIQVESLADQYSSLAMSTLRPEPVPLVTKVVLIGNPRLYQMLYNYDEDFKKLFKVKVDFSDDMERNSESELQVAKFAALQAGRGGVRHFHRDAVARVVEYSSRLVNSQRRLSTNFNELGELLYEADAWAGLDDASTVERRHVNKAIHKKIHRSNRWQEYRERMLSEGKLLVSTQGDAVGQINGLSVLSTGDYQFGVPVRITANTFAGRGGIINIEREIKLSGHIHSKGVLTLSGYLGQHFAQRQPLALSASITFEQLYGGVEGDSASGAELFALLSSLADVALTQGIAVTGSVNQKGEIQPVGGINEKIEGWFETCALQGLTGTQGVIIPRRNVADLMLNDEVLVATSQGRFHVYAMDNVSQGLEILTGMAAGEADNRGEYPANSIFGAVQAKLDAYGKAQPKNIPEQ